MLWQNLQAEEHNRPREFEPQNIKKNNEHHHGAGWGERFRTAVEFVQHTGPENTFQRAWGSGKNQYSFTSGRSSYNSDGRGSFEALMLFRMVAWSSFLVSQSRGRSGHYGKSVTAWVSINPIIFSMSISKMSTSGQIHFPPQISPGMLPFYAHLKRMLSALCISIIKSVVARTNC